MAKWKCYQCNPSCTLERDVFFNPERCIYNERGNDKKARWEKVDDYIDIVDPTTGKKIMCGRYCPIRIHQEANNDGN